MLGFLIFLGVMFFLVAFGVPIAYGLGLGALALMVSTSSLHTVPLSIVAQRLFSGVDNFTLVAVPLFMIAGNFMERGGMSERIVKLVGIFLGKIRGGLAVVSVACCMFFAGISGSAVSDAAAVGGVLLPMMKKNRYPKDFSAAIVATAGTIGPIIPPSIPFVIYGVTCGASIGKLFLSGVVPGILIGIGLMIAAYFVARKIGLQADNFKVDFKEAWVAFKESFLTLLAPLIIIVGIISGTFTPTEIAAVAAIYAFILGVFVYRELKLRDVPKLVLSALIQSAGVMFIVAVSGLSAWFFAKEQMPVTITNFLSAITNSPIVLLIIINVFLLGWGMIMDLAPTIMILGPIFLPILNHYGINVEYFGVIMVVNLCIGLITPPVGVVLYVMSGIGEERPMAVVRAALPFLLVIAAVLILMILVPSTVTWFPSLFLK